MVTIEEPTDPSTLKIRWTAELLASSHTKLLHNPMSSRAVVGVSAGLLGIALVVVSLR